MLKSRKKYIWMKNFFGPNWPIPNACSAVHTGRLKNGALYVLTAHIGDSIQKALLCQGNISSSLSALILCSVEAFYFLPL